VLAAQRQDQADCGELNKDRSENEEDARVLSERLWMIDPQRGDRGREKEERNDETFCRFGLRAAENQKSQTGDERGENQNFDVARVLEAVQQFVTRAPASLLFRSESALAKPSASEEI
jgi:hypothetical protein